LPNCSRNSPSHRADSRSASIGSYEFMRPRQRAVPGMNWAMPSAPLWLRACGLNRLSCQISRVKNSTGSALSDASRPIAGQMVSTMLAVVGGSSPTAAEDGAVSLPLASAGAGSAASFGSAATRPVARPPTSATATIK
jgi:hypothetical protein